MATETYSYERANGVVGRLHKQGRLKTTLAILTHIDEELFVGKSYFFQLKRNGRHLNIIDVRPLSEASEQIEHDGKGGE